MEQKGFSGLKKRFFKISQRILLFLLGVFLLYIAFKGKDFNVIYKELSKCDWWWILIAKLFGILAFYIRALRWKMLINTKGYQASARFVFYAIIASLFANLVIPRIGELYRCWVIKRKNTVPMNYLIGTVVVERVVDVVVFLFFTL
ncbi:MAG: UPF0104 family protein, partial [Bacteroidetes bacterium]